MKINFTLLFLIVCCTLSAQTQNSNNVSYVESASTFTHVNSLASRINELTPAIIEQKEMQDGIGVRRYKRNVIPNKGRQKDIFSANPHPLQGSIQGRNPDLVFDAAVSGSLPTDPALAVGPNHVFVVFNTGFTIYDKDGNQLLGQTAPEPAIFPMAGCCDLTVSYDPTAVSASNPTPGRWVLSYLTGAGAGAQLAVSDGPDPINDGWNVYNIQGLDDYNKLSIWSDGYYMTDNDIDSDSDVFVIDRQAAIDGEPAANVGVQGIVLPNRITNNTFGFLGTLQVLNVTDDNMPDPGNASVIELRDDSIGGVSSDGINVWTINVDFDNPANTTVSNPQEIDLTPFDTVLGAGFGTLDQANGGEVLNAIPYTIMNQAQYRKFSDHNSAVFNFSINISDGGILAGIRWVEFRQTADGEPWTLFQEGTFASPDNKHAWMGSLAMDEQGNIGMGYSAMNGDNNVPLGIYQTGRFANDPPGVMSIGEQEIAIGATLNSFGSSRYGDYSKIDIDPIDNQTFWYIGEYSSLVNDRADVVGRFQIAPEADNDVGIVSIDTPVDGDLSALQDVTVTIFNFGINEVSNFEVSYTIDGGTPVVEMFTGTIASATSAQFTFSQQADLTIVGQTYVIEVCTALDIDENEFNDCATTEVIHLNPDDVGVTSLIAPISASGLSDSEDVTIEITNFGSATQTSIPVFYTIDGGAPIMEIYTGSIAQNATDTYTFTVTQDLSELGDFVFVAGTELPGDADTTNDDITETVSNFLCMPTSDCAGFGDGVTQIQLVDQDVITNCGTAPDGYSDDTDTVFNFILDENPFEGTLQVGFGGNEYAIWIDFNDNNNFESDELVSNNVVPTANQDFNFTIDLNIPVTQIGMHTMRVRTVDPASGDDPLDPCANGTFGRTNDYTANISGTLSTEDSEFASTDLEIRYLLNNQFEVIFNNTTSFQERLPITIYNTLGQALAYYTVENNGFGYSRVIDMSYAAAGIYFIKIGDNSLNKVAKVVVN